MYRCQQCTRCVGNGTNLGITNNVEESDHVGSPRKVLEDLDLSLDLLLLDWLEHLDDTLVVRDGVDSFKHLGILHIPSQDDILCG